MTSAQAELNSVVDLLQGVEAPPYVCIPAPTSPTIDLDRIEPETRLSNHGSRKPEADRPL